MDSVAKILQDCDKNMKHRVLGKLSVVSTLGVESAIFSTPDLKKVSAKLDKLQPLELDKLDDSLDLIIDLFTEQPDA